ncbi:CPBP family intramembrane glutamic endopeptidase [Peribacillus acanthi]|uniref:CPBP family intramembrane glutamic endopeptidase n=1 Tax=Peribacillus acanthi TaxID=2171554 RepID=UPI000D3E25FC|nr:CPBP family intramembrane glutamic endopeptidase [Peribacillus acanthi]
MIWFSLIFIFVAFIFPIIDYFWDKRIKQDLKNHNKIKTYSLIMLYQWTVVALIFLGFYLKGISFKELGFVSTYEDLSNFLGFLAGILVSVFFFLGIYLLIPFGRKKILQQYEAIEVLLPNGWKERLLFAGVAVTAGFCEEVIFRGFMFYYLDQLNWNLSLIAIAIITSILFGLAHGYQGWKNIIFTGLVGFAMARLYMQYESIWIPIILHIVIDLRFAVLPNLKKVLKIENKAA